MEVHTRLVHLKVRELCTWLDNCNIHPAHSTHHSPTNTSTDVRLRNIFTWVFPTEHVASNSLEVPVQYFAWLAADNAQL